MTDETQTTPADTPPRPLGTPVGGQEPASQAAGAMTRILDRVDDPELRKILDTPKGGQLARAVAGELDDLRSLIAGQASPGAPAMMTDMEATALEEWLLQHFTLAGHTPNPGERLVNRVMLTLHGLVKQLQELQRTLSSRKPDGTPVK